MTRFPGRISRFLMTIAIGLGFTGVAFTQSIPEQILDLRQHAGERLGEAAKYTCTLEIFRVQDKRSEGLRIEEKARLEVAYINGKERYSWPGESSFRDDELRDILLMGLSGAGSFATHLRSVVFGAGTVFGSATESEGGTVRIPFQVPAEESGYLVNVNGKEIEAAIQGSITFSIVGETRRIAAFELHAMDLPPSFPATAVSESIEYGTPGGRSSGLSANSIVPQQATQRLTEGAQDDYTNQIRFTRCREFAGDSTIRFDSDGNAKASPSADLPSGYEISTRPIPSGVPIDLELSDSIDWGKQQSGDAIEAKLARDVRWKGRLLLEEGAIARGRIVELKKISGKSQGYLVGIAFDQLIENKRIYSVKLGLESLPDVLKGPRRGIAAMVKGENPRYSIVDRGGHFMRPVTRGGTFRVEGDKLEIPKGFEMRWVVESRE